MVKETGRFGTLGDKIYFDLKTYTKKHFHDFSSLTASLIFNTYL